MSVLARDLKKVVEGPARLVYKSSPANLFDNLDTGLQKPTNIFHPFLTISTADITASSIGSEQFPWVFKVHLRAGTGQNSAWLRFGSVTWAKNVNNSGYLFHDIDQYKIVNEKLKLPPIKEVPNSSLKGLNKQVSDFYKTLAANTVTSSQFESFIFDTLNVQNGAQFEEALLLLIRSCGPSKPVFLALVKSFPSVLVRFHKIHNTPLSQYYTELIIEQVLSHMMQNEQLKSLKLSEALRDVLNIIPEYNQGSSNLPLSPEICDKLFQVFVELKDPNSAKMVLHSMMSQSLLPTAKHFDQYIKLINKKVQLVDHLSGMKNLLKLYMSNSIYKSLIAHCSSLDELHVLLNFTDTLPTKQKLLTSHCHRLMKKAVGVAEYSRQINLADIIIRLQSNNIEFSEKAILSILKFYGRKNTKEFEHYKKVFPLRKSLQSELDDYLAKKLAEDGKQL